MPGFVLFSPREQQFALNHHVADKFASQLAVIIVALALLTHSAGCAARRAVWSDEYELTAKRAAPDTLWLDELDLSPVSQEWGQPQAGKSVDGNAMTLDGVVYRHGLGTHAYSEVIVDLKGVVRSFHTAVGIDDESKTWGSVVFSVWVDGEELARSDVLRGGDEPGMIFVDLTGAQQLTLIVEEGQDNIDSDHANWAGAMLVLAPEATAKPETIPLPTLPPPPIMRDISPQPAIHAPRVTGSTPGLPFLFRVPATGDGPLRFSAAGLPAGLELEPDTGIITGSLSHEGSYEVDITVEGPKGYARSTLRIVGRPHALALTPPMGWNSWNVWGTSVDDAKVRQAADWMVASGLAAVGYQYINIDDAWEGQRDADGRMQTNDKFPDMKALADYVHSKGLKLGIYSSPGPQTCAGYEGSYEHEFQDANTFAEWGIDLIKYDWCSYGKIAKDDSRAELRKPYDLMRNALDQCGRDIVFSICQYGMGDAAEWGAEVGGNYWRTTGDITDTWPSMARIGFGQNGLEAYATPGHWNDPDMLVVGHVGWGPDLHPTRLTAHEQITHITLWSLLASPLLIGCDLSQLDDFTLALLTNPEVLEVNQDPMGQQARRFTKEGRVEVWARDLADGSIALGLFNRWPKAATVKVGWSDLGLTDPQQVRDLWHRTDLGEFEMNFATRVAAHGAVMLRVRPLRKQ